MTPDKKSTAEKRTIEAKKELPIKEFSSVRAWTKWLDKHHETSEGVRIKMAKKASGIPSITHAEALDVALRYGWIDSRANRLDHTYWLQRFTPRRARSKWSRINRDRAEELISTGEMKPAGMRQVEAAKADGRWGAAYASPNTATVPDDLKRELNRDRRAREFFATLSGRNRYAILYRIADAKRPETRRARIEKIVAMLHRHEKFYP